MSDRERTRERDLVLAPNEYAFISDETKGNINVYVGPHKTSLANTDQPVVFTEETKRFDRVNLEEAINPFAVAPVGWYVLLKNPAKDGLQPKTGSINNLAELEVGRKKTLAGPVSFALWPGQMVRIIQGHHLRSNQYLVVRVYDEEAAKANWGSAVIKPHTSASGEEPGTDVRAFPDLTMGNLLVIRGTDVSFYIPPTGVEVVPDVGGRYVREAVTLERLEYCILLDENGDKKFLRGPAVVFPSPTETFVERDGAHKFRAIELNENSGIYVKVIAPYGDPDGTAHKVGDELFITGREQMIYFPRPEHAAVKYGSQAIHYAVAIPAGEARYVLDRHTGQIRLERGPRIFLPDPRREVIVRRILDRRQVEAWFPGNADAIKHNERLAAMRENDGRDFVADNNVRAAAPAAAVATAEVPPNRTREAAFVGDDFDRKQGFTQPRTIILDTRYDGAVAISPHTGYAVQVVSKTGERKVVVGPSTYLLEYDEVLQSMDLSTGTPKSDTKLDRTVYLRVLYNKVSDVVEAETADLVTIRIRLSYRVNFEGDPNRWFNVENYVKFLTEHLRSLVRAAVKTYRVQDLHPRATPIIRDVVLGQATEGGKRPGRSFVENGMRVYDVEVLDVDIGDSEIADLLVQAQHAAVEQTLTLGGEQRRLELVREKEAIELEIQRISAATNAARVEVEVGGIEGVRRVEHARIAADAESARERITAKREQQEAEDALVNAELERRRAQRGLDLEIAEKELDLKLRAIAADVQAVSEKAKAVSPELIAALQAFGDRALAEKMAESMAPLAILGGESVSDVLAKLLKGTKLAKVLETTENGSSARLPSTS
jgi:major vault protein